VPGCGHTRKCSTSVSFTQSHTLVTSTNYIFVEDVPLRPSSHPNDTSDRYKQLRCSCNQPPCWDKILFHHTSQPPDPYRLLLIYNHANHLHYDRAPLRFRSQVYFRQVRGLSEHISSGTSHDLRPQISPVHHPKKPFLNPPYTPTVISPMGDYHPSVVTLGHR